MTLLMEGLKYPSTTTLDATRDILNMTNWLQPSDVCVVTGGCNGLGAAIIKRFALAGCPTVALDIVTSPEKNEDEKKGESTEGEEGASSTQVTISLTDDAETAISASRIATADGAQTINDAVKNPDAEQSNEADSELDSIQHRDPDSPAEENLQPSLIIKCDVRSEKDLSRAREQIFEKFQRYPSVLVCNAGVRRPLNSIANTGFEDIEETIEVNLAGPLKCVRTFLPDMLHVKRGFVVTVGSALGLICPKGLSVYGASKAGVLGFHEALEQDLAPYKDVHALLVCPGQIDTSMFADIKTPSEILAPIVQPEKLAKKIVKRVTKAKTSTIYSPAYVRYLPLMRAVPTPLANIARKWSGVDKVYDDIVKQRENASAENGQDGSIPGLEASRSGVEASGDTSVEPHEPELVPDRAATVGKEPQNFVTNIKISDPVSITEDGDVSTGRSTKSHRNWFKPGFLSSSSPSRQAVDDLFELDTANDGSHHSSIFGSHSSSYKKKVHKGQNGSHKGSTRDSQGASQNGPEDGGQNGSTQETQNGEDHDAKHQLWGHSGSQSRASNSNHSANHSTV